MKYCPCVGYRKSPTSEWMTVQQENNGICFGDICWIRTTSCHLLSSLLSLAILLKVVCAKLYLTLETTPQDIGTVAVSAL